MKGTRDEKDASFCGVGHGVAATSAQAEFAVGGWINLEYDKFDDDTSKRVRGDLLASYATQGGLTFGLGFSGEYRNNDDTDGYQRVEGGNYAMVAFGDSFDGFEFGVVIPFGKTQPAHGARDAMKDYTGLASF